MSGAEGERATDVPSTIPGNWAVPAQESAAAAGVTSPPRPQSPEEEKGHPVVWFVLFLVTAAIAWLVTVGFLAPDAPVDKDMASALEALEPPPVVDELPLPPVEDPPPTEAADEPAGVPSSDPSFPTLPPAGEPSDAKPKDTKTTTKPDDAKPGDAKPGDAKNGAAASPTDPKDAKPPAEDATVAAAGDEIGDGLPVRRRTRRLIRRAERRIELKNYAGAGKLIKQALALDPNFARAHRARAVVCAQRGDAPCARESYEAYLKLAPDAPDAPDVRRLLELGK